jgi:hypothetical protein
VRDSTPENEAARLYARDLVDLHAGPRLHQFVHGTAESTRVTQQCRYVAKDDAGFGIIRDIADCCTQIFFEFGRSHESQSWPGLSRPSR